MDNLTKMELKRIAFYKYPEDIRQVKEQISRLRIKAEQKFGSYKLQLHAEATEIELELERILRE